MRENRPSNSLNAENKTTESDFNDLAKIFNYPAIGELFSESDTRRLDAFRSKLNSTRDELERVVRYGNQSEADSAMRAAKGIEITLEFLKKLQEMRLAEKK